MARVTPRQQRTGRVRSAHSRRYVAMEMKPKCAPASIANQRNSSRWLSTPHKGADAVGEVMQTICNADGEIAIEWLIAIERSQRLPRGSRVKSRFGCRRAT